MSALVHSSNVQKPLLDSSRIAPDALRQITGFHADVIDEVERAIAASPVVVVGMAQNPFVKKVRKALAAAGVEFTYLEYGSYFSGWKKRLAIKLWSGWPTFPQVFVRGVLLGGKDLTVAAIAAGRFSAALDNGAVGNPEDAHVIGSNAHAVTTPRGA